MSETIDKGAAMTAVEIRDRLAKISAKLGEGARVSLDINARPWKGDALVAAYPDGICGGSGAVYHHGDTFEEALARAEAWAATYQPLMREKAIRKLALDIIDLTDQHGSCTVAMLRGRQHSQADIDAYTDAACVRAGELAGNAPFEVRA